MPNDQQHVADLQRRWGFDPTPGPELYRTPSPDLPRDDVVQLDTDRTEALDEQQQIAWAERTINRNRDAHQAAAARAAPPVPPAAPAPDITTARAELRTAIMRYGELHELAQRADEAVQRATERVADCDALLEERYKDLEQRIVGFYAEQARQDSYDPLPPELAQEQRERGEAIDRVCAQRSALEQLKAEAAEARAAVKAANIKRGTAAVRIVSVEMDRLAARLAELNSITTSMRRELSAVAATFLPIPDATTVLALSTRASSILTAQPPPLESDSVFSQAIRNWHARLMSDSEAKLGDADDVNDDAAAA